MIPFPGSGHGFTDKIGRHVESKVGIVFLLGNGADSLCPPECSKPINEWCIMWTQNQAVVH